jgi:hypothetical protein
MATVCLRARSSTYSVSAPGQICTGDLPFSRQALSLLSYGGLSESGLTTWLVRLFRTNKKGDKRPEGRPSPLSLGAYVNRFGKVTCRLVLGDLP